MMIKLIDQKFYIFYVSYLSIKCYTEYMYMYTYMY